MLQQFTLVLFVEEGTLCHDETPPAKPFATLLFFVKL
jgi:hypothetical protein